MPFSSEGHYITLGKTIIKLGKKENIIDEFIKRNKDGIKDNIQWVELKRRMKQKAQDFQRNLEREQVRQLLQFHQKLTEFQQEVDCNYCYYINLPITILL